MHSDSLKQPISTGQDLFCNFSSGIHRFSVHILHGKKKKKPWFFHWFYFSLCCPYHAKSNCLVEICMMRMEVAKGNKPTYASQAAPIVVSSFIYRPAQKWWNKEAKLLITEFCDKGCSPADMHLCNCMCMSRAFHTFHTYINIHRSLLSGHF